MLQLSKADRSEAIASLAQKLNETGRYLYSSNTILKMIGGTAAEVKAQIAAIRNPTKQAEPPERGKSLRRPAEGW